jgi:hypothetical protein
MILPIIVFICQSAGTLLRKNIMERSLQQTSEQSFTASRELLQNISDEWHTPPAAIRVCVLNAAPVVSPIISNSVADGAILSATEAENVRLPAELKTAP